MMQTTSRSRLPVAGLLALAGLGAVLLCNRPVQSQSAETGSAHWTYKSVMVEADSLQNKLDDLGKENWEVFFLVRADSIVEQGVDGQTHVVAKKYQVTARKRSKR